MTWPRVLGLLAVAGAALLGAGSWTLLRALEPAAASAEPVVFEVPRGASLGAITRKLEAEGLIRNARAAGLLARFRGLESALRAGEYRVSAASTPDAIFDLFARGQVATY
ncbi:MAG: endolytic transglycosylase MltG, partial [Myxococcota bacterium]